MNLYLRLLWTWLRALSKQPIELGDTIEMPCRVWPNDLDINGHMNNGRYMTITDLALVEHWSYLGFGFRCGNQTMATGHAKGALVGSGGLVRAKQTFAALGRNGVSPEFPKAVAAWIEPDRLLPT